MMSSSPRSRRKGIIRKSLSGAPKTVATCIERSRRCGRWATFMRAMRIMIFVNQWAELVPWLRIEGS